MNISKIGLGTVQFGLDYGFTKKKTQAEVDEILYSAGKRGIALIDTARSYGDSEEKIGQYTSQNKNNFIVATKLEKIDYEEAKDGLKLRDKVYTSIEKSLQSLKIRCIDILQIHQTEDYVLNNPMLWEILKQVKEEMLVNSLGISVYEEPETLKVLDLFGELIDYVQVPYNIFDRRFEKLTDYFNNNNVSVISRSVFLKGIIACKESELPEELIGLRPYKKELFNHANKLSLEVGELALMYVYNKKFITSSILGVNSAKELENNMDTIERLKELKIEDYHDVEVDDIELVDPREWKSM